MLKRMLYNFIIYHNMYDDTWRNLMKLYLINDLMRCYNSAIFQMLDYFNRTSNLINVKFQ